MCIESNMTTHVICSYMETDFMLVTDQILHA